MARAKTVFDTSEIPHLWAHQTQVSARNKQGNLYFQDEVIYSYGPHFAIARHVRNAKGVKAVLFTTRTYSNTTAGHIRAVRGSIPASVPVIRVDSVWNNPSVQTLDDIQKEIDEHVKKSERAKLWKGLDEFSTLASEFEVCAKFIGSRRKAKLPHAEWFATQKSLMHIQLDAKAEQRAKREAQRQAQQAIQREKDKADFEAWFHDTTVSFPYSFQTYNTAYMRVNGDEIETSQGARVSLEHVRRVAPFIIGLLDKGESYRKNGHTLHLGHYEIESLENGVLTVGCHRFDEKELRRIAAEILVPKVQEQKQEEVSSAS